MNFLVPTRFLWRFGGAQVHLCGSFTRWVETVPMHPGQLQVSGLQCPHLVLTLLVPGLRA